MKSNEKLPGFKYFVICIMYSVSANNADCSVVFVVDHFNILYSCSHPELYLFCLYIAVI
jgi:hypothetical protein